jgi:hypothetical protein
MESRDGGVIPKQYVTFYQIVYRDGANLFLSVAVDIELLLILSSRGSC